MKKLSLMDNGFLMAESVQAPSHVAGLLVFKLPKGVRQKDFYGKIMKNFGEMAAVTPPFNQRLQLPLFNLGQPGWVMDEDIDLSYHIRHSALPGPGTMEQLKKLVSRLHSNLLDRTRPLWEVHLIEGLRGGRFALYFKIHHACIDGVGSMNMIKVILSTSPEAEIAATIDDGPSEQDTNTGQSANTGVIERARAGLSLAPEIGNAIMEMGRNILGRNDETPALWYTAPKTILNRPLTGQRRVAVRSFSLDEFKRVRVVYDVTLNDVVLSICSGALRRYLLDKDALPGRSLNACLPVSVRPRDDTEKSGNVFATMMCRLGTHIDDPLKRLCFVNRSTSQGKAAYAKMSPKSILGLSMMTGAPLVAGQMLRIAPKLPLAFNLVISNVQGAGQPLYMNGARMESFYGMSLLYNMQALTIAITSYVNSLDFCLVSCRKTIPDLNNIIDYIADEFDILKKLSAAD